MLALFLLATAPLRFHFEASEFTNAVYHVACLTGQVQCSSGLYAEFWNERYNVTREDGAGFDAWKDVFDRFAGKAPVPEPMPLLPNYARHYPALRARQDLMAEALASKSPRELERRARKLVSAEDAAQLRKVAQHVQQRLRPWWKANGRMQVAKHRDAVERYIETQRLKSLASGIARFLHGQMDGGHLYIHLVPGPMPHLTDAKAALVSNHFLVEVLPADQPRDTVWKAMHELTHAIYETAPRSDHAAVMKQFIATGERQAQSLYAFLNEAIATGVQLLLFERLGLSDGDAYRHPYILRLARAAMPLIKDSLCRDRRMLGSFPESYMRAATAELGAEVAKPKFLLSVAAILASEKNHEARNAFYETFQPIASVTKDPEWRLFVELNAVRLLTYDELEPYTENIPDTETLQRHKAFVYVKPHGRIGIQMYVAARDEESLREAVNRLADLDSLPRSGITLTL